MIGTIIFIDYDKGYGFLKSDEYPDKLHFKILPGYREFAAVGKEVMFQLCQASNDRTKKAAKELKPVEKGLKIQPSFQGTKPNDNFHSEMPFLHCLPQDTWKALIVEGKENVFTVENIALAVEKYVSIDNRDEVMNQSKKKKEKNREKGKIKHKSNHVFSKPEIACLKNVYEAQKSTFEKLGAYQLEGTLSARMIIGLGSASVFDTGIILHKPYGFPYIPASSVKGALRHFIMREAFDVRSDEEEEKLITSQSTVLSKIFGNQEAMGDLVFFDAYPKTIRKLEQDIMNPHFSKYYVGEEAPTDDQNPVPVTFLAVPQGTVFTFGIAGEFNRKIEGKSIIDWFMEMLEYHGIGAKTAVGYGWFSL